MMDKNLFLAVGLSMGVYLVWFGFIEKRYVKPAPGPLPALERAGTTVSPAPAQTQAAALQPPVPAEREGQAEKVFMGSIPARIHPRGAALVSYQFRGPLGAVELIADPNPGALATWPELVFKRLDPSADALRFGAQRPDGLSIVKEFLPESAGQLPKVKITLSNPTAKPLDSGPWTLSLGPGLGTIASEEAENEKVWRAVGLTKGEGMSKGKVAVFEPGPIKESTRWLAVDNRYFLCAVAPAAEDFAGAEAAFPPKITLTAKSFLLEPGAQRVWEIPYYLGAKGHTWLTRYGHDLERSIDFGFFAGLGRFMLGFLDRLEAWTGNWGWAIILFTVILQIVLFPLTYKGLKATAAMKKLQPEIAKLQQKYGKEPTRLNTEMMALYKRTGASPFSGCLPMLLQMPIFIALFNTLRNAWELHGASWIFWVKDLSAKDPYYVLPIVMGALMVVQNRFNPPSADPVQAKMMTWMPVIFTFMFLQFPSGLVLYWLTNSVLSVIQQTALKSHFEKTYA